MADTKQLISLSRVNATGGLDYYYPKTVAAQVYVDESQNLTVAGHVTDTNIHLSAAERTALNKVNTADGYVRLGTDGFVPTSLLNPSVLAINTEFADINALKAASVDEVASGQIVMVLDASADETVGSGWAIYRRKAASTDLTDLASWQKVAEAESLDVVLSWDNITGKPTSTVAAIDKAVADDHMHTNKAILDIITDIGTSDAPVLAYNGKALAYAADATQFHVISKGASIPSTAKEGDFVLIATGTLE